MYTPWLQFRGMSIPQLLSFRHKRYRNVPLSFSGHMCSVLDMIYSTTPVTPKDNKKKKKFYAADFTKQGTLVAFSLFLFLYLTFLILMFEALYKYQSQRSSIHTQWLRVSPQLSLLFKEGIPRGRGASKVRNSSFYVQQPRRPLHKLSKMIRTCRRLSSAFYFSFLFFF